MVVEAKKIKVADVVFRDDLYPRIETSATTVQKYAEDLSILPPIDVNQNNELIDGWHRLTAHKKKEEEFIQAVITKTTSDANLLELAIESNARHGLQLSQKDKQTMARKIYNSTAEKDRDEKKKHLAKILSVSKSIIHEWLSNIDRDSKAARNALIQDLWLACYTQEEIAETVGVDQKTASNVLGEIPELEKLLKPLAEHAVDFTPPLYSVWRQGAQTEGIKHFGNSEVRWLDNLLYLYTKPLDTVVDPFAGSGSTIDLCRKRMRRYFVSDRKPIIERSNLPPIEKAKEIRLHDICPAGSVVLPKVGWKDVRLVYLDPPYWKQAEGQYSEDPSDLANMELDTFHDVLAAVINGFSKKLTEGYIALIIQPTQWKAPEKQFTDHVAEMLRRIKLPIDMRYSVPYQTEQCTPQMVEWAKAEKRCLVISREIIVWSVA